VAQWFVHTVQGRGYRFVAPVSEEDARSASEAVAAHASKRVMLVVLPETISDLGPLAPERLGVIARTSAMIYKGTRKSIAEIGRELGVDYALEC
jgi:hypothetical protein